MTVALTAMQAHSQINAVTVSLERCVPVASVDDLVAYAVRLDDLAAWLRQCADRKRPEPLRPDLLTTCADCGVLSVDIVSHRCRP